MTSRQRLVLPAVALVCYLASFFLPALYVKGQANTNGLSTYIGGLGAWFDGFFALFDRQYAWLANPLAAIALLLLLARAYRGALGVSLAALLVAQHTWMVVHTLIWGDEGGVTKYLVTSLGPGFYLWCSSFALLVVASVLGMLRDPPSPADDPISAMQIGRSRAIQ
jgi:hypothetical protein